MDDADGLPGHGHGQGDLGGLVVHQDHVGGLDGGVGTQGAHGDAHIAAAEDGGVVDAVAHEGHETVALIGQDLLHPVHLLVRQEPGVVLIKAQLRGHGPGGGLGVAGEHHGALHAAAAQGGNGGLGVGFHLVRDEDAS